MSDELIDPELHPGVHDVPLLQRPGDCRVVDGVHLNRSQHGHPDVLEVKQEDVSHSDGGDLLLGVVEVEVSVLDDRDVEDRVEQDTCVTSRGGSDTVEVALCVDSVEEDVVGLHDCTKLILCHIGHCPHLSVGVCRVIPVDGCGPVGFPHHADIENRTSCIDDISIDVVLNVNLFSFAVLSVLSSIFEEVSSSSSIGGNVNISDFDTVVNLTDFVSGRDCPGNSLERGLTIEVILMLVSLIGSKRESVLKRPQKSLIDQVRVVGRHLVDIGLVCDGVVLVLECLESESVVVAEGDLLVGLPEVVNRKVDRIGNESILVGSCTDTCEVVVDDVTVAISLSFPSEEVLAPVSIVQFTCHSIGCLLVLDTNSLMVVCPCTESSEDVVTGEDTDSDLLSHDCVEVSLIVGGTHSVSDGTCRLRDRGLLGIEVVNQIIKPVC